MIPKIREVHIRNYKSIAQAVVPLSDLTLLVGANGSGKTNFVDALAFVQECVSGSVESALRNRGGGETVFRRGAGLFGTAGFRFIIDLDPSTTADYAFEISFRRDSLTRIARERCAVSGPGGMVHEFSLREGEFEVEIPGIRPRVGPDRLALYAASAAEEFRGIYDFLAGIRPYQIRPDAVGALQEPGPGQILDHDGGNAAAVLRQLQEEDHDAALRVEALLGRVVPGVTQLSSIILDRWLTIRFTEEKARYQASSMSEGTLRLLGLLLAVYQISTPSVLIVEEPELAIHPAAAELVMSVLLDASTRTQVLVTTHSPDILDHKSVGDELIRVVTKESGKTLLAPLAQSSRYAIRKRLYSPGELLRSDELNPDTGAAETLSQRADLFGPPAHALGEVA